MKNKCYEVSHFVILSSLLSPLHQGFLLSNLWPTSQVNFVVLWNMIHSKGYGISQRDLLICCTLTAKPGTTPDSLQETTSERILEEFSGEKGIFLRAFPLLFITNIFPQIRRSKQLGP